MCFLAGRTKLAGFANMGSLPCALSSSVARRATVSVPLISASQPLQPTAPPPAGAMLQLGTLMTGLPHGRT